MKAKGWENLYYANTNNSNNKSCVVKVIPKQANLLRNFTLKISIEKSEELEGSIGSNYLFILFFNACVLTQERQIDDAGKKGII